MMLTQEEAFILGIEGRSQAELQAFQQCLDNWDYGARADFKKILPCIQNKREFRNISAQNIPAGHCRTWLSWRERPVFENDEQRVIFLQLLRQMREAWKFIAKIKKEPSKTNVFDALARYEKNRKYWDFPEFLEITNKWSSLNRELVVGESHNSAFNKVYQDFRWYIRQEHPQDAPCGPAQEEDQVMENAASTAQQFPKNLILYGSPGTGKTYKTVQYAVAIVENKAFDAVKDEGYSDVVARYRQYRDAGRICFTTFHQSYEYEEFIEGLRPRLADEDGTNEGELSYEIHDGVFKRFCQAAEAMPVTQLVQGLELGPHPTVWKISLERTGENPTRRDCLDNGHIRIGWDGYGSNPFDRSVYPDGGYYALNAFYNRMQVGDIVLSCYSNKIVDAVGVVTGEPEWHDGYSDYKRLRKVRWLAKDIRADIYHLNGDKVFTLSALYRLSIPVADILAMIGMGDGQGVPASHESGNFVFIIDEINRGNMAKIFGELMTLIEESKRLGAKEEMRARLPYTGDYFGVPGNVFIIGTMNTADRSIALMDVALRRRFSFIEVPPEPALLADTMVAGIRIEALLDLLNRRIEALLDREHVLGHATFLMLREKPELQALATIMENKILPLLQEYFYDDYAKIQLVLGDNQKTQPDDVKFIKETEDGPALFGNHADAGATRYSINSGAFADPVAYRYLGLVNGIGDTAATVLQGPDGHEAAHEDAH